MSESTKVFLALLGGLAVGAGATAMIVWYTQMQAKQALPAPGAT